PSAVVIAHAGAEYLVPGHDVVKGGRQRAVIEAPVQAQPVGDRVPLAERSRCLAMIQRAQELLVQRERGPFVGHHTPSLNPSRAFSICWSSSATVGASKMSETSSSTPRRA